MAIQVTPLHPTLGAEVRGVDLSKPVMPDVFAEIEASTAMASLSSRRSP